MATNNAGKAPVTEHNTNKNPVGKGGPTKVMINPHANAKRPGMPSPVNRRSYKNSSQFS